MNVLPQVTSFEHGPSMTNFGGLRLFLNHCMDNFQLPMYWWPFITHTTCIYFIFNFHLCTLKVVIILCLDARWHLSVWLARELQVKLSQILSFDLYDLDRVLSLLLLLFLLNKYCSCHYGYSLYMLKCWNSYFEYSCALFPKVSSPLPLWRHPPLA